MDPATTCSRRLTAATAALFLATGATILSSSPAAAAPTVPAGLAEPTVSSATFPSIPGIDISGTWVTPSTGGGYLTFHPDGSVSGSDGCNSIMSRYHVTGLSAQIDPMVSTLMTCFDSSDEWLGSTTSVDYLGSTLVVHGEYGIITGILVRN